MNHTYPRVIIFLALVLGLAYPGQVFSAELVMRSPSEKISAHVSDIRCVSLDKDAPTEVLLEETGDVFRVYDSTGAAYSATSLQEAADGYLRLKGVCVIREIKVVGQSRISVEAIRFRIKTMPGSILHQKAVRKDIEEIYSMGYFETCDATYDNEALSFSVKEYPVIISLDVKGNTEIKTDEILKSISMKKFDILNTKTLKTSIDRIVALYKEKGYFNAEVTSSKTAVEGGINLVFEVKENDQLYVKEVGFDGNEHISDREINGILGFGGILETKTHWWWGLFGHSGSYVEETLDTDLLRIEQLYGDRGYVKARAGRPITDIREGDGIYITIPIEEGPLFTIGAIDVSGDLIKPKEELINAIPIKTGDIMSKGKIHQTVEILRGFSMDAGFAYAQVKPDMTEKKENSFDINFVIKQGKPVHIETIYIRGNSKTRDKVIRREFKVNEGDLYSSTALSESKDGLGRLGYFKGVNVEPIPKSDDTMSLLVDVEETTTGAFSFGFAYSSLDHLMGTVSLSESNLFGYGLKTKLSTEYGGSRKSYSLDFEDPWLFDHPVSLGASLYNMEREYTYYTKDSRGGNIRISYPLFEKVRHSIIYSYTDVVGLSDIDSTYEDNLTEEEIEGYILSSVTNTLYRDTTNDYFRPTRGSDASLSLEYTGLGGDYHFTRMNARYAHFFPLYKDKVALMLKFRWGTINPAKGDKLPEDELYVLGGMNSIRGFGYGDIGPMDSYGNIIGGRRMVVCNTEITFPIFEVPGLSGAIFFDQGNAYVKRIDLENLKRSYGIGIRWVTPMGPLRIEYGKVIHPEEWEDSSKWDFSIGTFF